MKWPRESCPKNLGNKCKLQPLWRGEGVSLPCSKTGDPATKAKDTLSNSTEGALGPVTALASGESCLAVIFLMCSSKQDWAAWLSHQTFCMFCCQKYSEQHALMFFWHKWQTQRRRLLLGVPRMSSPLWKAGILKVFPLFTVKFSSWLKFYAVVTTTWRQQSLLLFPPWLRRERYSM